MTLDCLPANYSLTHTHTHTHTNLPPPSPLFLFRFRTAECYSQTPSLLNTEHITIGILLVTFFPLHPSLANSIGRGMLQTPRTSSHTHTHTSKRGEREREREKQERKKRSAVNRYQKASQPFRDQRAAKMLSSHRAPPGQQQFRS